MATGLSAQRAWVNTSAGWSLDSRQGFTRPSCAGPGVRAGSWARGGRSEGRGGSGAASGLARSVALALGASGLGALMRRGRRGASGRQLAPRRASPGPAELEPARPALCRRQLLQGAGLVAVGSSATASLAEEVDASWIQYDLNTGETLYDVDFDPQDPNHGFVVGARGLFYETKDGGRRWVSRSFANLSRGEDISYRFQTVSVNGNDVWIVGKPPLLLHSKDAGKSWKKVPVSRKLPGEPKVIVALGEGKAELATSSGAVYRTENDGKNWKAFVNETVDATLNRVSASGVKGASYFTGSVKSIKRDPAGKYLAVAQRGNFYLTFTPGDERWVPHNRISARRIQAMGFRETADGEPQDGVWMSLNGGSLTQTTEGSYDQLGSDTKELFKFSEIRTGGIGIIDVAFRTPSEGWAVGGSGVIYVTKDGGKTWQFDSSGTELPCNLYNVKFFNNGKVGYMIGSAGILLRKQFAA